MFKESYDPTSYMNFIKTKASPSQRRRLYKDSRSKMIRKFGDRIEAFLEKHGECKIENNKIILLKPSG